MGETKHKTRSIFGPGCIEAPKDGDQVYPGVPKGPKWKNQSVKRGSRGFFVLVEAPKDGDLGYPGVPKSPGGVWCVPCCGERVVGWRAEKKNAAEPRCDRWVCISGVTGGCALAV